MKSEQSKISQTKVQPKKPHPALSAQSLKQTLWDTLNAVKDRTLDPTLANAVSANSREIMRVVKIEVGIAKVTGKKQSASLTGFFA
jgi:hypothetical protein